MCPDIIDYASTPMYVRVGGGRKAGEERDWEVVESWSVRRRRVIVIMPTVGKNYNNNVSGDMSPNMGSVIIRAGDADEVLMLVLRARLRA